LSISVSNPERNPDPDPEGQRVESLFSEQLKRVPMSAGPAQELFGKTLTGIRTMPGIKDASAASWLPLTGLTWTQDYAVEGEAPPASRRYPQADDRVVMPGYFRIMGIPVVPGSAFEEREACPARNRS